VSAAGWFELSPPMAFGMPQFSLTPILIMVLAMLVIMAETTGNCLAIGKLVGKRPTSAPWAMRSAPTACRPCWAVPSTASRTTPSPRTPG
jgi:xanthine/uracil permease